MKPIWYTFINVAWLMSILQSDHMFCYPNNVVLVHFMARENFTIKKHSSACWDTVVRRLLRR